MKTRYSSEFHIILLLFSLHFFCFSQEEKLQPIGTVSTHVMFCPCKLFKYYENNSLFYYCKDIDSGVEYTVKEIKHKKGLDIILDEIDRNLFQGNDSVIKNDSEKYLNNYLNSVGDGKIIDFLNQKAVLIDKKNKKTIFFSDQDLIASYEITIKSSNSQTTNLFFEKSINSLRSKKGNIKTIF